MSDAHAKKPLGRPKGEQTENAAKRRKQLVEAAIDSIVTHGMSATTLATVSKAAGLSQGVAVFYFKSKENLLTETLKKHYEEYQAIWKRAQAAAPDDPFEQIMAIVYADLDPIICNNRNLTLWNSYWGEATARPKFAELCDYYDKERYDMLVSLCRAVEDQMVGKQWDAVSVADTLDTLTDGFWIRIHITPNFMSLKDARGVIARYLATVFPQHEARIFELAKTV